MSAWWQQVGATLQAEFSDLSDPAILTRTTVRLLLAAALGGVLGYERETRGKAAGFRTHILVSLGAALFVLIPQQSKVTDADMTRVVQGLVAGIGFIGAGAILRNTDSGQIEGLTTAAGIWLTAAIGVAVGMGREATAIFATVLALGVLSMLPRIPTASPPPPQK